MGFGDRLAVVVIDVTLGNVDERWTPDAHVRNIMVPVSRLLKAARAKQIPVFYTTGGLFSQTSRAARITDAERGSWIWKVPLNDRRGTTPPELEESMQIPSEIAPGPDDVVIRKIKPSGFFESPLYSLLTRQRIDTLIICGTATNSGVLHTVCEAFSYNYRAIVPRECCATKDPEFHDVAFEMMDRIQSDAISLQAVLDEIGKRPPQLRSPGLTDTKPVVLVMHDRDSPDAARTAHAQVKLLRAARASYVPVIHAVNTPQIRPDDASQDEPIILRRKPSSFCETPLRSFLTYYRADTLIVCGSAPGLGLLSTVNDANCANYRVIVPRNCVDSSPSCWHETLMDMMQECAKVVPLEEALAVLSNAPGRPAS